MNVDAIISKINEKDKAKPMSQGTLISKINIIEKFLEENITFFKMYRELDSKAVDGAMTETRKKARKEYYDGLKNEEDKQKAEAAQLKQKKKNEKVVTKGVKPVFKRSVKPLVEKKKEVKKDLTEEEQDRRRFLGADFEDAFMNADIENVDA